jgi:hypothetical protein
MTYRDDRDADRARIAALEADLAKAERRVAELEGRREVALVQASSHALARAGAAPSAAKTWLGAPLRLALTRRWAGAFPTDGFEDVIERLRELTRDPGRSELLRSSLTWSATAGERSAGPFTVVTITVRDGQTTLTVTDRLGALAGALFGGVLGGVGGGGLVAPIAATIAVPLLAPVFFAGWLGGIYAGTRALFRRTARRRAEAMQQLFDALVVVVEAEIAEELAEPDAAP